MSFERLIDYLSGVTFEVSLAKGYIYSAKTTADHSTHRYTIEWGKRTATYVSKSKPMQVTIGVVIM